MIKNILFDFDGTIVDTRQGIVNCMNYALEQLRVTGVEEPEIIALIGLPLEDMFVSLFRDSSPSLITLAVGYFRERYSSQGLLELSLYDGVEETLQHFSSRNIGLYIVTSKPLVFTQTICKNLHIENYFTYISGIELTGISLSKTERIKTVLKNYDLHRSETLMVGDRYDDILAARQNGISSSGILHGFGSREELVSAGCDSLIDNFRDLKKIV